MNHRTYLTLAIPLTISTMTTPLLGAVDTAVVGQLSAPAYIAGVAVGTLIFNTLYWVFGFLRVSTSAFAAQANGASDPDQGVLALSRPFLLALIVGMLFILLQWPIEHAALLVISPDADVSRFAVEYFRIRIWGAPFILMNYVILGWLMGMAKIKESLCLQILTNVLNMLLAILFVHVFSFDVQGVATATLIAEVTAFILGLFIILKVSPFKWKMPSVQALIDTNSTKRMFNVNKDLFIRTICLLVVINMFTAKGASFGTEFLAANAVLFQIHYIMAYFFDGFANASSILVGKAVGSNDKELFKKTLTLSRQWSIITAVIIASLYALFQKQVVGLFTNLPDVIELSLTYGVWLIIYPFVACFGLVLYGVFTGATEIAPVRNSMIYAMVVYIIIQITATPIWHNHGLWLAFIIYTIGRSGFLVMYTPRLNKKLVELKGEG
ncbi:MATE family efflux transporter [Priestia megaterium]|uniref:MATE family efflux transporter n=1 Tax=Priestia megaterium TaxID=1404 RepID=UPI000BF2CD67|nr:MATE family efflux transporter [Priestia megaterium]MCT9857598.1 MATE family efflux transporter [Priestia megaterium]MDF1961260.1 MATE family efflux transporter [Priestia megaterium]MDF2014325.1 MATE family efflux transporter [Priestia megaterium]MED4615997.1 MATE family efflux transporter [Priestia megaterium]PEW15033.1 MATE family efflux transporter [Priestia megaterium]